MKIEKERAKILQALFVFFAKNCTKKPSFVEFHATKCGIPQKS